jgi:hypothetical protein
MERDNLSRLGCTHNYRQRNKQEINSIVDDPRSSYPSPLLLWLRLHLKLMIASNNPHYKPQTFPPAA